MMTKMNKYQHVVVGKDDDGNKVSSYVDVYDVLKAFKVTCPAMAHAIKKMLVPGTRGYKDSKQDKQEAIDSIARSIELDT